jgi:hypothetical protein
MSAAIGLASSCLLFGSSRALLVPRYSQYILTCTQIHSVYTRIYGLAAVFMCSYKYIMRYTESYLYVC